MINYSQLARIHIKERLRGTGVDRYIVTSIYVVVLIYIVALIYIIWPPKDHR